MEKETERAKRESALASLYEEYYDKIARYIFLRIGDQSEAEDLASEVFIKAFRSLGSYQERGLPMQSWLFKIAHNLVVDYLRKKGRQRAMPIDEVDIPDPANLEEIVETHLQVEKLSEALKYLSQDQREVIGLRFFAGLSSVEAGKFMGKRPGAVRQMQNRALKSLRQALAGEFENG